MTTFEQKTPVKSEVTMPIISVTAKPLMGPVPNWKSTTPAMSVVTWPSKIEENARS